MATIRVVPGTMNLTIKRNAPRILRVGRVGLVSIDTHVPSSGKEGRRINGGDKPKLSASFKPYERVEVFGYQCNPKTATGNTKGDPVWDGTVPRGWRNAK